MVTFSYPTLARLVASFRLALSPLTVWWGYRHLIDRYPVCPFVCQLKCYHFSVWLSIQHSIVKAFCVSDWKTHVIIGSSKQVGYFKRWSPRWHCWVVLRHNCNLLVRRSFLTLRAPSSGWDLPAMECKSGFPRSHQKKRLEQAFSCFYSAPTRWWSIIPASAEVIVILRARYSGCCFLFSKKIYCQTHDTRFYIYTLWPPFHEIIYFVWSLQELQRNRLAARLRQTIRSRDAIV